MGEAPPVPLASLAKTVVGQMPYAGPDSVADFFPPWAPARLDFWAAGGGGWVAALAPALRVCIAAFMWHHS